MFSCFWSSNLLAPNQSGFKSGDFCINQLLSITHEIYSSFDDGFEVRSFFLDIIFKGLYLNSSLVSQGSILSPLLFKIYINDLSDDLSSNANLSADDTSLFSVVHNINASAIELDSDLNKINDWPLQWKMTFNPDRSKQT